MLRLPKELPRTLASLVFTGVGLVGPSDGQEVRRPPVERTEVAQRTPVRYSALAGDTRQPAADAAAATVARLREWARETKPEEAIRQEQARSAAKTIYNVGL